MRSWPRDRPLPARRRDHSVAIGIASSGRAGTIALQECDRRAAGAIQRSRTAEFGRLRQRPEFAEPSILSKHDYILRRHGPYRGSLRLRSPGCRLARRRGHLIAAGTRAAPTRPIRKRGSAWVGRAALIGRSRVPRADRAATDPADRDGVRVLLFDLADRPTEPGELASGRDGDDGVALGALLEPALRSGRPACLTPAPTTPPHRRPRPPSHTHRPPALDHTQQRRETETARC